MARYRKIDVRIWGDGKFRDLTPIPPCGQGLWLYLLTSPYTTNIPGLYRASEGALADDLKWPLKAFRKAFLEASLKDMVEADWTAPLVWIRKAITYNQPESPNVVKSWRSTWDEIPEVPLKVKAYTSLKAFTEGLGQAFAKAFVEGCVRPAASDLDHPSPNQEQEQDQEQIPPLPPQGGNALDGFDAFWNAYPKDRRHGKYESQVAWRKLRPTAATIARIMQSLAAWKASADWCKEGGKFIPWPQKFLGRRRWEEIPDPGGAPGESAEQAAFEAELRAVREGQGRAPGSN